MGIVHLMPLGESPGAVTTALAHFKHTYGKQYESQGKMFESIVLFTTKEMRFQHKTDALLNRYEKPGYQQQFQRKSPVDIVVEFVRQEIQELMPAKGKIYWCEMFAYDYQNSFRSVAETALTLLFKKNCWLNLTGGTNIMNAALLQMAYLSGLVSRAYYIFVEKQYLNYLQPLGKDKFSLYEVPLLKTTFDEAHHAILLTLEPFQKEWVKSNELLGLLKSDSNYSSYFTNINLHNFEQEFLKKMGSERGIERKELQSGKISYEVRLNKDGRDLLTLVNNKMFYALTHRGEGKADFPLTFAFEELWTKSEG